MSDETEQRTRFGLLLLALVAAFAVQGIAEPGRWEELIVSVLLATTLVLAAWVAKARPRVMKTVGLLAVLTVALALGEAIANHGSATPVRAANLLLVAVAPPAVVVGVVRSVRARQRITIEAVFGVLCLYLLLGMFFAFLYGAIGQINGPFFAQQDADTVSNNLYFSFTTLTTVGYGDLTAKSNLGHTLSVSEALVGQIYLVTVVSLIVGNLGRSRIREGAEPPRPGAA